VVRNVARIECAEYPPDFSVVLFRSDFVLVSEKNHMKVHKNQGIGTMPILPNAFLGSQAEDKLWHLVAQKPSQRPDMVRPHRDVDLQLLDNKALSRGSIRKSACILAEITVRKSQLVSGKTRRP
jgi:hypothetical protein